METELPFSYLIDYTAGHIGNESYYETVSKSPPGLLHLGQDVPFSPDLGLILGNGVHGTPMGVVDAYKTYVRPSKAKNQIEKVKSHVKRIHDMGVDKVIVYFCNSRLTGNHQERTGFWSFYDHWDEFADYGFGPKPPEDPIHWMTQGRRTSGDVGYFSRVLGIYERSQTDPHRAFYTYWPCANHPHWRQLTKAVIQWIARCGYDGVFLDVNDHHCYCSHCQAKFADSMRQRYSDEELLSRFGLQDPSLIFMVERPLPPYSQPFQMTEEWEEQRAALRDETLGFLSECSRDFHLFCLAAGREIRDDFFFVANIGPMLHQGAVSRVQGGQDVTRWSSQSLCTLIEETQHPGKINDVIVDNVLAFSICKAAGQRAAVLSGAAQSKDAIALSMAEAAVHGGLMIQGGYDFPEIRKRFDTFWKEHGKLLANKVSWAKVCVLYHSDELFRDNREHLRQIRQIVEHLSDHHVPFEMMMLKEISLDALSRFQAVILPSVKQASSEQIEILTQYGRNKGYLLPIGCAQFGPTGQEDPYIHPFTSLSELLKDKDLYFFDLSERECNRFDLLWHRIQEAESKGRRLASQPPGRLMKMIDEACGFPANLAPYAPAHLRVKVYVDSVASPSQFFVHLLNYDVGRKKDGATISARPLRQLEMRLPGGEEPYPSSATLFSPGDDSETLAIRRLEDGLHVTVPFVRIWSVVWLH